MIIYIPAWGNTAGMYPILLTGFGVVGLNGVDLANHRSYSGIPEVNVTADMWRSVVDLSYKQANRTITTRKISTAKLIRTFAPAPEPADALEATS